MNDDVCLLVTILYRETLIKCAVKVKFDLLPGDCVEYPMEPENRKIIHALLPLHVRTCGPIVAVERLFEVHINKDVLRIEPLPATKGVTVACTIYDFGTSTIYIHTPRGPELVASTYASADYARAVSAFTQGWMSQHAVIPEKGLNKGS